MAFLMCLPQSAQFDTQPDARAAFVSIARSWISTPYVFRARVKGQGSDCSTWLAESLIEAGLATHESLYGSLHVNHPDWWLHATDDVYKGTLLRHAQQIAETVARRSTDALPGCILLQKAARSRVYNHGAVVTEWPMIIHCLREGVVEVDATKDPMWTCKAIAIFNPFA